MYEMLIIRIADRKLTNCKWMNEKTILEKMDNINNFLIFVENLFYLHIYIFIQTNMFPPLFEAARRIFKEFVFHSLKGSFADPFRY